MVVVSSSGGGFPFLCHGPAVREGAHSTVSRKITGEEAQGKRIREHKNTKFIHQMYRRVKKKYTVLFSRSL